VDEAVASRASRGIVVDDPTETSGVSSPVLERAAPSLPSDVGTAREALTNGWCDTGWWSATIAGYGRIALGACPSAMGFEVCWNQVSGDGSAWHNEIEESWTNVCPAIGTVKFVISGSDDIPGKGSWTVATNTARWHHQHQYGCDTLYDPFNDCPTVKAEIKNASSAVYNFRFLVDDCNGGSGWDC
jgi:hypothetical protein